MSKHQPLAAYLRMVDADSVTLTVQKIEEIIDASLPGSAYNRREWWGNNDNRHYQAKAWLFVGWNVESVSLSGETVTFQ